MLCGGLVIARSVRINRPGHQYRLTVEVETLRGRVASLNFCAFQPDRGYIQQRSRTPPCDAVLL